MTTGIERRMNEKVEHCTRKQKEISDSKYPLWFTAELKGSSGSNSNCNSFGSSKIPFRMSVSGINTVGKSSFHEMVDNFCPPMIRGIDHLRDPRLYKGMAFTIEERQSLGIHGLFPPRLQTQEEQVALCLQNIDSYTQDLHKYIYLMNLLDRNEKLFYRLLTEYVQKMMPIVYTPTVGLACQKYGLIFRRPRGLFITINDQGHVLDVLRNWPERDVKAIVVTDGERILGLGDLGAYGMGIPIGKLALYSALAGVKPHQCLPITLDVGTNRQELLDDKLYIGLKQKRVTGNQYDKFIDEFMEAVVKQYGQNTLIQFEDFGNQNAFRLLEKYRDKYCTFNDDIQGTGAVILSGLLSSLNITDSKLSDHKILFQGAGEAALGIANLCVMAMHGEGISLEDARRKIWMVDSKGLIVKNRPDGGLTDEKSLYAQDFKPMKDFDAIVREVKPSVLIGASINPGSFTPSILQAMAAFNKHPVVFALSNPTTKAECTAQDAYEYTKGSVIFASGSPFPPVRYQGQTYETGQGNNAYIFPGVALGIICGGIRHVSDELFLVAARALADMVTPVDLSLGRIFPSLTEIRQCSVRIATEVVEHAYCTGMASKYPEPKDKEEFIKAQLYDCQYCCSVPEVYEWPRS